MLSGERLLIVEEEYLIASDIQRVLEDANAADAVFAKNYNELQALQARFAEFHLAIVTPPRPGTPDVALAALLATAGPALVICTANKIEVGGTALEHAEIVYKPFSDEQLLAACVKALAKRSGA